MAAYKTPSPTRHTSRFDKLTIEEFKDDHKIIVSKHASEDRANLTIWDEIRSTWPERLIQIERNPDESVNIYTNTDIHQNIELHAIGMLKNLLSADYILIDISGLDNSTWAPIVKATYHNSIRQRILYAEPKDYTPHPNPSSDSLFDLSVEYGGSKPLPAFANLRGPDNEQKCLFVSALGFEGNRPESLYINLESEPKVIPIIGVPGFKFQYPTYTIASNRRFIKQYGDPVEIRLARASCPFEVTKVLREIRRDYSDYYMYLAPVGTKPHSLGIVWFALSNPDDTEIVYDHPIKKLGRTKGVGTVHIYDKSKC